MPDREGRRGFWATLPGILTGLAAVITAVGGLVLGLYQYGVLGARHDASSVSSPGTPASEARPPSPGAQDRPAADGRRPHPPRVDAPRADAPGAAPKRAADTVQITAADGTVTTIYADGFQHRQTGRELVLRSGQSIPFEKIKAIDVERQSTDQANVRVTLVGGPVVEGAIDSGLYPHSFVGRNDVGEYGIRVEHLKRIVFARP